jgi:hypothetical protein
MNSTGFAASESGARKLSERSRFFSEQRTFYSNANFILDAIKWLTAKAGIVRRGKRIMSSERGHAGVDERRSGRRSGYFKSLISQYEAANTVLRERLKQPSMQAEWVAEKVIEWMDELEM